MPPRKKFTEEAVDLLHHELEVFSESLHDAAPVWLREILDEHVTYMHDAINEALQEPDSRSEKSRLRRFAYLHNQKKALEARIKTIVSTMGTLEEKVKDYLIKMGMNDIGIVGNKIYLKREIYFKRPDNVTIEELCAALKDDEYEDLVKEGVNSNTLSALLREWDDKKPEDCDEIPIPEKLQGVMSYSEVVRVRVMRKPKK